VLVSFLHTKGGSNVRRLAWILLAAVALLAGCEGDPSTAASPPERAILSAAPEPGVAYVAIVGDSYTYGSPEGGHGPHSWASLVVNQLQKEHFQIDVNNGAVGASGYVAPGHQSAGVFADQVGRVVGTNDNLVVLFGSRNDETVPADQLTPAVQQTLDKAKQLAPKAKFLVIGPIWPTAAPSRGILQVRDIVRDQASAIGATFVDPIGEHWFWGRPDLIGSDGKHPTDEGHVYMVDKIAPVMTHLLPLPPLPQAPPAP
jgi:lysophospholipase L1-like esterase